LLSSKVTIRYGGELRPKDQPMNWDDQGKIAEKTGQGERLGRCLLTRKKRKGLAGASRPAGNAEICPQGGGGKRPIVGLDSREWSRRNMEERTKID